MPHATKRDLSMATPLQPPPAETEVRKSPNCFPASFVTEQGASGGPPAPERSNKPRCGRPTLCMRATTSCPRKHPLVSETASSTSPASPGKSPGSTSDRTCGIPAFMRSSCIQYLDTISHSFSSAQALREAASPNINSYDGELDRLPEKQKSGVPDRATK